MKQEEWMRPTEASPLCRYEIAPGTKRAMSTCGVWVTPVERARMVRDEALRRRWEARRAGKADDFCPLCARGKRTVLVKETRA